MYACDDSQSCLCCNTLHCFLVEAKVTKTVLKLGLGIFDLESIRILNLHNSGMYE